MLNIDVSGVQTPAYVVDEASLRRNLGILADAQDRAGCKILLALKGFAMWSVFPIVREYLHGAAASSPDEARLAREHLGGEVHAYAPAYSERDIELIGQWADHIVFNSFSQWRRLRPVVQRLGKEIECGIRINPEHSEVSTALYDPCAPNSRLGVRLASFSEADLDGITGLHFHTLCELGSDALERTLAVVEQKFGPYLREMQWVNFGGGHHITRPDYDVDLLVRLVSEFRNRYDVRVYLEPGEAIALRTGILVASVLDLVDTGDLPVAILDTSATAHMPDVLEMPYRPEIVGGFAPGARAHTYRLGGLTCLAGDVIGDWSFDQPLEVGRKLVFLDMAHYTMVKTTTFNGVHHPDIAIHRPDGTVEVVKRFGYDDYKGRLS
jgi:carboxynorspermidine decarboxylase